MQQPSFCQRANQRVSFGTQQPTTNKSYLSVAAGRRGARLVCVSCSREVSTQVFCVPFSAPGTSFGTQNLQGADEHASYLRAAIGSQNVCPQAAVRACKLGLCIGILQVLLLPRRVCCAWPSAMPVQHARVPEQAQENTSPGKN